MIALYHEVPWEVYCDNGPESLGVYWTWLTSIRNKPIVPLVPTIELRTTLIVDGFALSTTTADLRAMFTPYGSGVSCRIVIDHCGNSLRYGYVVMDSDDHADNAIKALSGKAPAGLPITVAKAPDPSLTPPPKHTT